MSHKFSHQDRWCFRVVTSLEGTSVMSLVRYDASCPIAEPLHGLHNW
jgi:hypothetical protein